MKKAEIGDIVRCPLIGHDVVLTTIYSQEYYGDRPDEGWQIEFVDQFGTYRAWKQRLDGGKIIQRGMTDNE